jgi:hypothetical protein
MKKVLVFILLLLVVGIYLWHWWRTHDAEGRGEELFYDRVWLDHVPTSDTDTVRAFAAIREEPLGIWNEQSAWKGSFELFRYEPRGDGKLVMLFPQSKERRDVAYRAWKCRENKFDFCLEVSGAGRGVARYFSQKGWEIGGGHDGHALLDGIRQVEALPAAQ